MAVLAVPVVLTLVAPKILVVLALLPMATVPVELPVLMLVLLFEDALILVVPPEILVVPVTVRPPVPCNRPEPLLTPTPTMAPALLTVKLPKEIDELVLPLMTVE